MKISAQAPLLIVLLALGMAGCQSGKEPGSMSNGSVQIQGHLLTDIQQTTAAVFREEGYTLALKTPSEMVFERPGSRMDAAKWGGWSGAGVTMRVKVQCSGTGDSRYVLRADGYAVENSDDHFFRTESRNLLLNQAPYQKLLKRVACNLN